MADKTEWPTDTKLEALRAEGYVPYSHVSTRALLTLLVILLLVAFVPEYLGSAWTTFKQDLNSKSNLLLSFDIWADVLLRIVVLVSLTSLTVGLVWGLLQTHFLFRPANIGLDLGNLHLFSGRGPAGIIGLCVAALAGVLAAILVGYIVWRLALGGFGSVYLSAPEFLAEQTGRVTRALIVYACIVLVALTILGLVMSRFLFKYRHRMSRAEVLKEQAEAE